MKEQKGKLNKPKTKNLVRLKSVTELPKDILKYKTKKVGTNINVLQMYMNSWVEQHRKERRRQYIRRFKNISLTLAQERIILSLSNEAFRVIDRTYKIKLEKAIPDILSVSCSIYGMSTILEAYLTRCYYVVESVLAVKECPMKMGLILQAYKKRQQEKIPHMLKVADKGWELMWKIVYGS